MPAVTFNCISHLATNFSSSVWCMHVSALCRHNRKCDGEKSFRCVYNMTMSKDYYCKDYYSIITFMYAHIIYSSDTSILLVQVTPSPL